MFPVTVTFVREPGNSHDPMALRAEVRGHQVGYLRRELASSVSPELDHANHSSFDLAGILRGGYKDAPNFGVHVWAGRRLSPAPDLSGFTNYAVPWPPSEISGAVRRRTADELRRLTPVDRYFALSEEIDACWNASDYASVIDLCRQCLSLVPAVPLEESDISLVTAIARGAPLFAAIGDRESLAEIRQLVSKYRELADYDEFVQGALTDAAVTEHVLRYVAEHPGVVQRDLHDHLPGPSKDHLRAVCYWAAATGRLERRKVGPSYSLEVPRDEWRHVMSVAPETSLAELFPEQESEPDPLAGEELSPMEELLKPLQFKWLSISPGENPETYAKWRDSYDHVFKLMVERNLRGAAAEKEGDLATVTLLYEANVRDAFEGNHPYDRLAVIYRKLRRPDDEVRVLRRAIEVFGAYEGPRTDVPLKLERFRARLAKVEGLRAKHQNL